jgi:hypothetical protein
VDKKAQRQAARRVGRSVLAGLRRKAYAELIAELASKQVLEVTTEGRSYQVEIESFWDDPRHKDGNLRACASVTDMAWSGFVSVDESFIVAPEGRFIGE